MIENLYDSSDISGASYLPDDDSSEDADYDDELQDHVNALLIRGIVFSIIWICGFGSAYSVYLGFTARRIIRNSEGSVRGMGRVWWCFIVGGFGICQIVFGLIWLFINSR